MKRIKRITSLIIAVFAIVLCYSNHAYAAENTQSDCAEESYGRYGLIEKATLCEEDIYLPINNDSSEQYFRFVDENNRMDSNGYFTFSFSWAMESTSFYPFASSITVVAAATSSNNNQTYYIGVKEVATDNSVGVHQYTANGSSYSSVFSGLDVNKSYKLYFSKPILSNATITGSGQVKYIQH